MNKKSSLPRLAVCAALCLLATGAFAAPGAPAQDASPTKLKWVPAALGGGTVTLDPASRLQLARSAAREAGLQDVGLDFRDVYGVISAETSWVPRTGMGRNGVESRGLAQFEPATAKAVGLRNPDDAVEAVHAAARLLREAAVWSAQRIARLGLGPEQRAAKLREGVSVYYNLSSQGRSAWDGRGTAGLPVETLRHIRNVRDGALQADRLNARMGGPSLAPLPAVPAMEPSAPVRTASAKPKGIHAVGTIEWSGSGGEGPAAGRRAYAVLSNGTVKPLGNNETPNGAIRWTRRSNG